MSENKMALEEIIKKVSDKELAEKVADIVDYIKAEKIGYSGGKLSFKGKRVGKIYFDNGFNLLIFTQFDEYLNNLVEENPTVSEFVEKSKTPNICIRCIDGKCACTCLTVTNPNKEMTEFAKRLIMLRKDAVLKDRVPKCNYVKLADREKREKCAKCKKCNPNCRRLKNF